MPRCDSMSGRYEMAYQQIHLDAGFVSAPDK